jgi:FAD synthase
MTPDAAFGYERRGTPEALAELGERRRFDVVVVAPFTVDGRAVRSSEIRSKIAAGNLSEAAGLLGRPVTLTGIVEDGGPDGIRLGFELPVALPPAGEYAGRVGADAASVRIDRGVAYLRGQVQVGARVTVELRGPGATSAR